MEYLLLVAKFVFSKPGTLVVDLQVGQKVKQVVGNRGISRHARDLKVFDYEV